MPGPSDKAAIARAHKTAEVLELWSRYDACCDYVKLESLAEIQQVFARFEAVELCRLGATECTEETERKTSGSIRHLEPEMDGTG